MPSSSVKVCSLEDSLCRPKSKKCNKVNECSAKCETECNPISCCPTVPDTNPCNCETAMDCCSLPYQRLDKLRNTFVTSVTTSVGSEPFDIYIDSSTVSHYDHLRQRNGAYIIVPTANRFTNTNASNDVVIQGFFEQPSGEVNTSAGYAPLTQNNGRFDNAVMAYNFVQTMRYSMFRDVVCTSSDQIIGFYINPIGRQLQVFQDLIGPLNALGLTYTDSLQYYESIPTSTMTNTQKQKLVSLNILNTIGIAAIRQVNLNPKTEGNILEFTDKCSQKWMLVINTSDIPISEGYQAGVNGYVVVACRI